MSDPLAVVPETVDALLEHTVPSLQRQYGTADALDQKAVGILAVSGALIAITGAGQGDSAPTLATALVIAAAAVWVVVTALCARQLWTKRYRAPLCTDSWWDRRFYDTAAVKEQLLAEAAEAYAENRALNAAKARAVRWALVGALVETVLIAAALASGLLIA